MLHQFTAISTAIVPITPYSSHNHHSRLDNQIILNLFHFRLASAMLQSILVFLFSMLSWIIKFGFIHCLIL